MTCDGLCGARLVATRGRAASSLGADEGLMVARMELMARLRRRGGWGSRQPLPV